MTPLESMTFDQVADIVRIAVPDIADDIVSKMNENNSDGPMRAVKPITKLLTLDMNIDDYKTITAFLITISGDTKASLKIEFIKSCSQMNQNIYLDIMNAMYVPTAEMYDLYQRNFQSVWLILTEDFCDGALFLETVQAGLDDPDDETAEMFLAAYDL
jgi:hypothetical protein